MGTAEIIDAHRRAGRSFIAGGVASFVRDEGDGPAVVCLPTAAWQHFVAVWPEDRGGTFLDADTVPISGERAHGHALPTGPGAQLRELR